MEIVIDYGSWLIEDLREFYKETLAQRDRAEMYSDRADLNRQALVIMAEILKRNNDERLS